LEIKLSIVIPTWNEELNIERLLIHLLANCKNSEIIIVDANSTDKTIEICKKYEVTYSPFFYKKQSGTNEY
jgi:glycosyltransferase involved in cell wall biosynthesis